MDLKKTYDSIPQSKLWEADAYAGFYLGGGGLKMGDHINSREDFTAKLWYFIFQEGGLTQELPPADGRFFSEKILKFLWDMCSQKSA